MSEEDPLSIVELEEWNVGGVEHYRAKLGSITYIIGANEAGKTSFLAGLENSLEGGHDPELIMREDLDGDGVKETPRDRAEVLITFSNGTTYRKVTTLTDTDVDIRTKDGGIVRKPATYIKNLTRSFDPIAFLNLSEADKSEFLLKTLPLNFSPTEVQKAFDDPTIAMKEMNLEKLTELYDGQYELRRQLNVSTRDLEGTIKDARSGLPPESDVQDWTAEGDRLQGEITGLEGDIKAEAAGVELAAEQDRSAKRLEVEQKISALRTELAEYLAGVDRDAAASLAEVTGDLRAEVLAKTELLGQAKSRAQEQQRTIGLKQLIEKREVELKGHVSREMRFTRILRDVAAMKHRKIKELDGLPEGFDLKMEKRKPVILIGGVPLSKLNRQRQLFVAMQFILLAAGSLPLIICEAAEIDDDHLADLKAFAQEMKIQLILARWVRKQPLSAVSPEEFELKFSSPLVEAA